MAPERVSGPPDWAALPAGFPAELVAGVRETVERADTSVIDPALLGPSFHSDAATTVRLLEEVAKLGAGAIEEITTCGNCSTLVTPEDRVAGICPKCGKHYDELDPPQFRTRSVFRQPAGRKSRDISWVVTAHGMNTDGPWQQDFSWLIANKLKYSAPVLILKYPVFRAMVLFERTQRLLVTDLGERLQAAVAHAGQRSELPAAPDVVLHSYGTLLFSRVLLDSRFKHLRFGRVILAGSIVPPGYDWQSHLDAGRIEQVVNHCGDKDWVVKIAQIAIPGTGPSGRIGFVDTAVHNVKAAGYGHGTFFDIEPMRANLARGGIWDRFLTYPPDALAGDNAMQGPASWTPNPLALVARLVAKLLAVFALVGPLIWLVMQSISAVKAVIYGK